MRVKGAPLRLVRSLTASDAFTGLLWRTSTKDFGLDLLASLPPDARAPIDDSARPIAGRAPHTWTDAGLAPPTAHRPTARTLHEACCTGATTPTQLLATVLDALDAGDFGDATHSPYSVVDREAAEQAAAAATARYTRGQPLGPLDGLPVPVKDEQDLAGHPTQGGTSWRTAPAPADAWAVSRLKAAGAVVYAKTRATEWGLNPWGGNAFHAMPRNAWHPGHGAGGSSTGSGVAVALGHAPVALGSDGGGSIRIPAALNGVYGIKPTFVRVGRSRDPWAFGSMSHLGPIGGSVSDLVDFLIATAGVDPEDPSTLFAPDAHVCADAWRAALGRGVRGCRIGVPQALWDTADPAVAGLARNAVDTLVAEGAELVDLTLPYAEAASAADALVIGSETAANLSDDLVAHGPAFGPELAVILRLMGRVSAGQFLDACRVRAGLRRSLAAVFRDQVDLIALPTTGTVAPRYPLSETGTDILWPEATEAMTRFAFLANLTGVPAGTVPCGLVDGLPVGLQFVGDAWDEASVLAAMAHCERLELGELGHPNGYVDLLAP
ncbi:MAG: amidase [Alphaproteobacteria bacterium]|nr:amidase [Alphaproteobacteria bacterium]